MKTKIILFLILVLLWAGCSNNDPMTGVKLKFKGVSEQSAMNGRIGATGIVASGDVTAETGSVAFNEVLVGVTKLEFEADDDNDQGDHDGNNDGEDGDDDDNSGPGGDGDRHDGDHDNDADSTEIEFEGNFIIDLIAGTSVPDFGVANIPPGNYEEIKITVSPILPDSNSVFIAFTFVSTSGDTSHVELSTKREFKIKIESDEGFQVDANVLNNLLVLIDLDKLLSGVDLGSATANSNGVIQINDSSNTEILIQILSNFRNSCHGGEDDDHDGDIDDD